MNQRFRRKFIYLISPNSISREFYTNLENIFKSQKIKFFQMRLKKYSLKGHNRKKIQKICKKHKVKFIINDDPFLTIKPNADGCHLGQRHEYYKN